MKILQKILLLFFLFANTLLQAQNYSVSGKVIDSETKEALAFVNIILNDSDYGTCTDIDGKFKINSSVPIDYIQLTYVGYERKIFNIENQEKIIIPLKRTEYQLPLFEVFPGENPAHRIINNVIKNRDINNPEMIKSFSYTSYDKMIFTANIDSLRKLKASELDSNELNIMSFFDSKDIFIMETVSERKFLFPDKNHEKVIASRISGFKDPIFLFLISQIQSSSFYEEMIHIADKYYINPISKGSTKKYFFLLEDTTYTANNDTVFIISYRPKKKTNFDGMKGVLSINTNKWAIQNVIAEPSKSEKGLSVKIQQMYDLIDGEQWFPVQLNTDLILNQVQISTGKKSYEMAGIGKSYLKDIVLNPDIVKKEFNNVEIEIEQKTKLLNEKLLEKYRNDSLSQKDKNTYQFIDSLGDEHKFDRVAKTFEVLFSGQIPFGFVNFDIDKFIKYNSYEGLYLGLGLRTSNKISDRFSVGGYWGYGFKDKTAKYGGDFDFTIDPISELKLNFSAFYDLTESGGISFPDEKKSFLNNDSFRELLIERMNITQGWSSSISFRALQYFKFNVSLTDELKLAYKDYLFVRNIANAKIQQNEFNFTELSVGFKYAYKEKFIKKENIKVSLGTDYPVFRFQYTKGFNDFLNGDFSYNRFDLKLNKSVYFKYIGKSTIQFQAGYIDGNIPYCNLYNGQGSYRSFTIYAPNSFATMRMNEFLSNKYLSVFYTHNFGKLLFRTKFFQPDIVLATNFAIGSLNNKTNHYNTEINSLEKGYYESGILLNDILNMKLYYIGAGVFCRYGPYSFESTAKNFAYKFTIIFAI
ncbi:MAG: carboxypeptidase-like regulatory domain-containing protein [Bacteroidales bacterium]|nr:carboxypeptidase-like regulatory domain-containing protein [Bacteroidales bacterium]